MCQCSHAKCGLRKERNAQRGTDCEGKRKSQKKPALFQPSTLSHELHPRRHSQLTRWTWNPLAFIHLVLAWEMVGCGSVPRAQALDQSGARPASLAVEQCNLEHASRHL